MRRHAPFDPTDLNICMWGGVVDLINCAKFFDNPSKGLGAVRPRKIAFPIEIVHRPYNSVGTTVPNCDDRKDNVGFQFPSNTKEYKKWDVSVHQILIRQKNK